MDCDKEKELAGKYKVEGFPTIKFFGMPPRHLSFFFITLEPRVE